MKTRLYNRKIYWSTPRTPIELSQNFVIFIEGKRQTVQEWLGIVEDQKSVFHPENNYDSVRKIWNQSIETQEEISDAEIVTLLQAPLRLPRETAYSFQMAMETSRTNNSILRYSPPLLLFCYYFMFNQDPYGCRVTNATLSSPALKRDVSLYEYVGQYWNRKEWLRLLTLCVELDFHRLAQRQQDKYLSLSYQRIWEADQAKWVKRRIARFSSSDDIHFNVWIGPLEDWSAVYEFEGEVEADGFESEVLNGPMPQPQMTPSLSTSTKPISKSADLSLFEYIERFCLFCLVLLLLIIC